MDLSHFDSSQETHPGMFDNFNQYTILLSKRFSASKSHQTFPEKLMSIIGDLDLYSFYCTFCKLILQTVTFREKAHSPT